MTIPLSIEHNKHQDYLIKYSKVVKRLKKTKTTKVQMF